MALDRSRIKDIVDSRTHSHKLAIERVALIALGAEEWRMNAVIVVNALTKVINSNYKLKKLRDLMAGCWSSAGRTFLFSISYAPQILGET